MRRSCIRLRCPARGTSRAPGTMAAVSRTSPNGQLRPLSLFSGPADGRWLAPGVSLRPAHHALPRACGCVSNWCVGATGNVTAPNPRPSSSAFPSLSGPSQSPPPPPPPPEPPVLLAFPCGDEPRNPARCGWYLAGTWLLSQEDQRRIFPDSEQPRRERIAGVTS